MLTFLPGPEQTPVTGMSANDRPKSVALRLTPALVTCLSKVNGAHLSNLREGRGWGGRGLASLWSKQVALLLVLKLSPVIHVIGVTGRTFLSLTLEQEEEGRGEDTFILGRPCYLAVGKVGSL